MKSDQNAYMQPPRRAKDWGGDGVESMLDAVRGLRCVGPRWWAFVACGVCLAAVYPRDVRAAGVVGLETDAFAQGDFDCDGSMDYVFGYPLHSSGRGRIIVVYPTRERISSFSRYFLYGSSAGDYFGDAVATGDFNNDGCDDVVVGLPGEDFGSIVNGGAIDIYYGTQTEGITTSTGVQTLSQYNVGIANPAESYDYYGEVLVGGDFDCDGYDDIAIGIPQENLGSRANGGALNVLYGSSGGLTTDEDWFHQNSSGIAGSVQGGDHFGGALAAGNFNGDSYFGRPCEDVAVGVPGEDPSGSPTNAGGAHVFYGSYGGGITNANDFFATQANTYVVDQAEAHDEMGAWLQPTSLNADQYDDLLVGVPGEDCSSSSDGIHFFYGSSSGVTMSGDILTCTGSNDPTVVGAADSYRECIEEHGYCECSDEYFEDLEMSVMSSAVVEYWACRDKASAAIEYCGLAPVQTGPSYSEPAANCIEATLEFGIGCSTDVTL